MDDNTKRFLKEKDISLKIGTGAAWLVKKTDLVSGQSKNFHTLSSRKHFNLF